MNRSVAVAAEQAAMDELARISRELETVNLLIVHFAQRPNVVKRLGAIRRRLLDAKAAAIAERERMARHI